MSHGFFLPFFLESSNKKNQRQGFNTNKYLKLGVYWGKEYRRTQFLQYSWKDFIMYVDFLILKILNAHVCRCSCDTSDSESMLGNGK